jgi:hypothetical protein
VAADVTEVTGVQPAPEAQPKQIRSRSHRLRFLFVYVVLGAALAAGIAGVALLVGNDGPKATPIWSSWQPTGGLQHQLDEIAARVGKQYRLPSGRQLLAINAKPLSVPQADGTQIKVNAIVAKDPITDNVSFAQLTDHNGIELFMCGGGPNCSIAEGKPTQARGRLVRREALELALYTFKYVDGVEHVVAFMPPPKSATTPTQTAVYWRRSDLAAQLRKPLAATLGPEKRLTKDPDQPQIDRLSDQRIFTWDLQPAPPENAVLVLQPPTA